MLAEYLWLAEQVTETEASVLAKASRVDLADSALHAPAAGFGDQDFYPDLIDKAAVLTCRLAWNHPLLDGNKRAAWAALVLFLDLNGVSGHRTHRTLTRPKQRCLPSPPTRSTRHGSPTGSAIASPSPTTGSDRDHSRLQPDHSRRGLLGVPKGNLEVCLGEIRVARGAGSSGASA
jgi:prophage maintenance system killer protein